MRSFNPLFIIFFIWSLLAGEDLLAQKQRTSYIGKGGYVIPNREKAIYYRVIRQDNPSDTLLDFKEFFFSDTVRRQGKVRNWDGIPEFEGEVTTWNEQGQIKSIEHYRNKKLFGEAVTYYTNGRLRQKLYYEQLKDEEADQSEPRKLLLEYQDSLGNSMVKDGMGYAVLWDEKQKDMEEGPIKNGLKDGVWKGTFSYGNYHFVEEYQNDTLLQGESTSKTGIKRKYSKIMEHPEFPGGFKKLYEFIGENYRFPSEARAYDVSGAIVIGFVVDKKGTLKQFKIVEDLGYRTAKEGINVLKKSPKWSPGKHRGVNIRVSYTLPIRLNLTN